MLASSLLFPSVARPCGSQRGKNDLIFSGIGKVVYAAADSFGGAAHPIDSLPPAFRQLSESRQVFKSALCSPLLAEIAFDAFMANRNELLAKLKSR